MRPTHFVPFLLLGASLAPGCASHSLREGIWKISFQATDHLTHVPREVPSREVKLAIDWSDRDPGAETIELELLDCKEPVRYRKVYTDLKHNGEIVDFTHSDLFWTFRMFGEVKSPEYISGSRFIARHIYQEQEALIGRWEMKWVRDS